MATTDKTTRSRIRRTRDEGFDVTCTIGRVEFASTGDLNPYEAAFLLVAKHDAPGTYSFPAERGGTVEVAVNYVDESEPAEQRF